MNLMYNVQVSSSYAPYNSWNSNPRAEPPRSLHYSDMMQACSAPVNSSIHAIGQGLQEGCRVSSLGTAVPVAAAAAIAIPTCHSKPLAVLNAQLCSKGHYTVDLYSEAPSL